ncbi:RusA family crossover junction endodeoxyribonuclease [Bosea lathyri]|uniref:Holliday junction resolvase RusA (Prophage-encoded endonuclease) n=1 Tax=Bosea lathyri TaxID=1036778 RepID=A0A1H6BV09_9HYPH|nr:RusA family crossover junction endodeoxyribonuclease [Bosea lathyri]SEG64275.1 Holliday junction resolvase RusA (prophage-encoded endonuclease) [Bosea lathyri]
MITIELAGAPRGKERVKRAQLGHSYTPDRTVRFEDRLSLAAQTVMAGRPLLQGPLKLDVWMHMAIPPSWPKKKQEAARTGELKPTVKPDWDNGGKLTDALNLIVWTDDAQITDGRCRKRYSDRPRTVITVSPDTGEGVFE